MLPLVNKLDLEGLLLPMLYISVIMTLIACITFSIKKLNKNIFKKEKREGSGKNKPTN